MLIALWLIGIERVDADPPVRPRGRQILANLDEPVELGEDAADGGETHVLDGEADVGMRRIDRPGAGRYRGRRGMVLIACCSSCDQREPRRSPACTGKPTAGSEPASGSRSLA